MDLLIRFKILSLICVVLAFAEVKTFDDIKDKPKGLAKDYYIYRLITEGNYTKKEAEILNKEIFRRSGKIAKEMAKIIKPTRTKSTCDGVNITNILDANLTCQRAVMTMSFMLKLKPELRSKLADKFQNTNPKIGRILKALNGKNPPLEFQKQSDTASFLELLKISKDNLLQSFDDKFDPNFINLLAKESSFENIARDIIINKKMPKFRQNFLLIEPKNTASQLTYTLGINAIMLNEPKKAFEFFTQAQKTFSVQNAKDAAVFWQYLITKDRNLLEILNQSSDINIYTLYANELTNAEFPKVFSPMPEVSEVVGYDIKDPFLWQKTHEIIKLLDEKNALEFAELFNTKQTMGQHAYFMHKASGYKDHYFITPFLEELVDQNASRKALIYAIARQESGFIPSAISTSYALGMMQFMPFVANNIAKNELKLENFDQDDMFDPKIALKFANHHLDYLEKFLHHPLFIAYAYNGGIGFTKRMLKRGDLFNRGEFEPFLSMELVPYAESRHYGKKVLANFIVYSKLLNSNTSILKLCESLSSPALTDKFRKID